MKLGNFYGTIRQLDFGYSFSFTPSGFSVNTIESFMLMYTSCFSYIFNPLNFIQDLKIRDLILTPVNLSEHN
jgi:hypothetical protein